jgi:hypothetical protein
MRPGNRPWADSDDAALLRMKDSFTVAQMAVLLNRHPDAVYTRFAKLGISLKCRPAVNHKKRGPKPRRC